MPAEPTRTLHPPLFATVLGLLLVCAPPAHADRPLQTEDAAPMERGGCELEAGASRERAQGRRGHGWKLQFGCGLPADTELGLAASRARHHEEEARELEVVGKTALRAGERGALSLAYGVGRAREDEEDASGWRQASLELMLVYTHEFARGARLHANLGHHRDRLERLSSTTWGLAYEHQPIGALVPVAELTGDDRAAPAWRAGLRWDVYRRDEQALALDLYYGRQVVTGRPRTFGLGLTYGF